MLGVTSFVDVCLGGQSWDTFMALHSFASVVTDPQ